MSLSEICWTPASGMRHVEAVQQPLPCRGSQFPYLSKLPLLSAAVYEAERNIKAPLPIIFCAALTSIAIASQGVTDVCKPTGQRTPTSIMLLAIANSGERKSTAENIFFNPIRDFQLQQARIYQEAKKQWQVLHDIWSARRKALLNSITKNASLGLSTDDEEPQLLAHDELQPVMPKNFKLLYEDSTSEALFHGLHQNLPTAGLTSSEGGGVLGGRAFNDLSKMNAIWSGDSITVDRKSAESFSLTGARLTVSIMAQETAVSSYLTRHGELSRGSGVWARFLVCHPFSTQGQRPIYSTAPSWECREKFSARLTALLQQNLVLLVESNQEKQLINFMPEAAERWVWIANFIESEIRVGGRFEGAGDHASKLADNIARLAALFHCFEGFDGDISMETLNVAINVCAWCSDEFLKIFLPPPQIFIDAFNLNVWLNGMRARGIRYVRKNHIRQYGTNKTRGKNKLSDTLSFLEYQGTILQGVFGRTALVDLMPGLTPDVKAQQFAATGKC